MAQGIPRLLVVLRNYKTGRRREGMENGKQTPSGTVELQLMKERMNTGLTLSQTSWKDLTQKAKKIGVSRKLVDQAGNFFIPN